METLHEIGTVGKQTMREFDEACLTPVRALTPEEIKEGWEIGSGPGWFPFGCYPSSSISSAGDTILIPRNSLKWSR